MMFAVPCPICRRKIAARTRFALREVVEAHVERCAKRHRESERKALIAAAQPNLFGGGS